MALRWTNVAVHIGQLMTKNYHVKHFVRVRLSKLYHVNTAHRNNVFKKNSWYVDLDYYVEFLRTVKYTLLYFYI